MNIVNQVAQTNDYSRFKTLEGNRQTNKLHVQRLKDSFQNNYLLSPILVNENYEIIDGQHRFQAARDLKLPVHFITVNDYGLREVQILNTNMKNWQKKDYLNGYCDLGYPEYIKFKKFMREFPDFTLPICETILTDKLDAAANNQSTNKDLISETNKRGVYANPNNSFKSGSLVIPNYQKAVDNAEKLMLIKPLYEGYNRSHFVRAMLGIFRLEQYSHSRFIQRLSANRTMLIDCNKVSMYKMQIEDIYNFRSREKVNLRF